MKSAYFKTWTILSSAFALSIAGCSGRGTDGNQRDQVANLPEAAEFILMYSNNLHAELDLCGCRKGQTGGFSRRASWVLKKRMSGLPVVIMDAGDLLATDLPVKEYMRPQVVRKAWAVSTCSRKIGLDAGALGDSDLILGGPILDEMVRSGLPLVCSNLESTDGQRTAEPFQILETGKVLIGVIAVLHPKHKEAAEGFRISDPIQSAKETLETLRDKVDLVVCLSHLGRRDDLRLRHVEGLDIILGADYDSTAIRQSPTGARVYTAPKKGRTVEWLKVRISQDGEEREVEVEAHSDPLDEKIPEDSQISNVIEKYHERNRSENLRIRLAPRPGAGGPFEGHSACVD